jgi:hypothetical protein
MWRNFCCWISSISLGTVLEYSPYICWGIVYWAKEVDLSDVQCVMEKIMKLHSRKLMFYQSVNGIV